jgi:hypothetical protein
VAALSLEAFALNKHRIAGVYGAFHPEFRYQPSAPPRKLGDVGRLRWVSSRRDFAPSYAGTDFIRIAPFIAFSTSHPELDSAATTCFARARKASQRELNLYFFVVSFVPATGSSS